MTIKLSHDWDSWLVQKIMDAWFVDGKTPAVIARELGIPLNPLCDFLGCVTVQRYFEEP